MRKTMSEPEVMLWSRLRGRGANKPTFRRQHRFGSLILDFSHCSSTSIAPRPAYCAAASLLRRGRPGG
jgi:very-short-patch-repair endonuclease